MESFLHAHVPLRFQFLIQLVCNSDEVQKTADFYHTSFDTHIVIFSGECFGMPSSETVTSLSKSRLEVILLYRTLKGLFKD
mmetsp:Transcript_5606/g.7802  ORF Transcript_5606/g.7802 Transcript_5606/m.7802 type:complete len:81 (+) Transcript_5606:142-384(+)